MLTSGLVDEEIKKEVLGWAELDDKSVGETVVFIEAKEMARDATNVKQAVNAGLSSYKKIKSEVTRT